VVVYDCLACTLRIPEGQRRPRKGCPEDDHGYHRYQQRVVVAVREEERLQEVLNEEF